MDPLSNLAFTTSGALITCVDSESTPQLYLRESIETDEVCIVQSECWCT
jgi:hypothetical protein